MNRLPSILGPGRTGLFARLVANGMAQAGAMIVTAWLVKVIFDSFITPSGSGLAVSLPWYAVGLFISAVAIAVLRMWERADAERMGQHYTHEVRVGLFAHMSDVSPRLLQRRSQGSVMLRFIGDLTALKQWVSLGVARLTVAGLTTFLTLAVLAVISLELAFVVGLALTLGAMTVFSLGGWLQNTVREARRRRARLAANVNEKIAALAVLQVFGQARRERRRVKRQSQRLMNAMVGRARAIGVFRGVIEFTAALASGSALLIGSVLVSRGQVTPGTVVAAMSIVGLLLPALRDLGRVQEYWHGAVVSREKISDFIALPRMQAALPLLDQLTEGPGRLEFHNVSVAESLTNFTAGVDAGQRVALVGPNGAGKSTLLSLAARLHEPDAGSICVDGQDLVLVDDESLRRAVGVMTPDLPLLRGSVERNLCYRLPKASDEAKARARALCGIDEMLANLPEGINTRVREGGVNLSLGQRQRIGLARAVLGEPRILLLDEVDANLDPCAAMALRRILAEYPGTILLVTHRLDWVKLTDQVWHIEQGCLVETGSPAALLNGGSATAQLFQRPKVVSG